MAKTTYLLVSMSFLLNKLSFGVFKGYERHKHSLFLRLHWKQVFCLDRLGCASIKT